MDADRRETDHAVTFKPNHQMGHSTGDGQIVKFDDTRPDSGSSKSYEYLRGGIYRSSAINFPLAPCHPDQCGCMAGAGIGCAIAKHYISFDLLHGYQPLTLFPRIEGKG